MVGLVIDARAAITRNERGRWLGLAVLLRFHPSNPSVDLLFALGLAEGLTKENLIIQWTESQDEVGVGLADLACLNESGGEAQGGTDMIVNNGIKKKRKTRPPYKAINFRSAPEIINGITKELIGMMEARKIKFYGRKPNKEAMYNSIILAIHDVETGGEFDYDNAARIGLLEALYEHGKPLLARRMREKPEDWPDTYYQHVKSGPPRKRKAAQVSVQLSDADREDISPLTAKYPHLADEITKAIESTRTPRGAEKTNRPAGDPVEPNPSAPGNTKALPTSMIPKNRVDDGKWSHTTGGTEGKKKSTH